jgi:hypothetical protein
LIYFTHRSELIFSKKIIHLRHNRSLRKKFS